MKTKTNDPKPTGRSERRAGRTIVINAYIKTLERSKINLTLQLQEPEKEEHVKPKVSRRKERVKIKGDKQNREQSNREN